MRRFDVKQVKDECVKWIQNFFDANGKGCNAIVGISGGKDSSVVAALCVEAVGEERVVGVLMPCGKQADIDMARLLVKHLDIPSVEVNIKSAVDSLLTEIDLEMTSQAKINLPPRIRMTTLYAVSQCLNGRVANTCNLSEDWVGYSTRYGDAAGDFSPLAHLTVTEVKAIGKELGLPEVLVEKTPSDGLCGKSDEDNLGFTYATLDKYIREGICEDKEIKEKIDDLHQKNKFKLELMPCFQMTCEEV